MSKIRITRHHVEVNPSLEKIPTLWRQALVTESLAPAGLRGGLARARTRLLDAVPPWQLPEVLDSLTTEGATV